MSSPTTLAAARRASSKKPTRMVKDSAKHRSRPKFTWRKRDTQDSQLYNLRLDINDIKQEIARLNMLRDSAVTQSLNRHDNLDGSCQKVVIEYFEVFAHGFAASPYNTTSYIYHAMSEDVQVNNFQGRDMVLEQWKVHSATFANLDFRYINGTVFPLSASRAIVKCSAHFRSTVTRQTLAIMFPHIVHRDDLVTKLVGKTVADFGQYAFEIDATTMQIVRCEVVLDYFSCFAKILKDPLELALLFGQALLVDEFYIGDVDDVPAPAPRIEIVDQEEGNAIDAFARIPEPVTPPMACTVGPTVAAIPPKMRLDHILDDVRRQAMASERPGDAY